jgi:hypothetical protein
MGKHNAQYKRGVGSEETISKEEENEGESEESGGSKSEGSSDGEKEQSSSKSKSKSSQEDYADRLRKKERWFAYEPIYLDDSSFG